MAEPGFFGSLANTMQSPLFLGGVGLLSGGGMQGMSQGIQTGILGQRQQSDQEQQRLDRMRQQQQDAENMRRWNTTDARAAETHPLDMELKRAHAMKYLADAEQAKSDIKTGGKVSLTPIYGTDADGNPVVMQPNQRGEMQRSKMPDGVTVSRNPIKMDAGTHFVLIDPVTRQPISTIPKDLAGTESAKTQGKAQGQAVIDLPGAIARSEEALATIEKLRSHPGKDWGTGSTGWLPGIPGTQQKDFVELNEQAKGGAFMQAFQMLKGGGAITNIEGDKATKAIARLDRSQSKRGYDAALADLEAVVKSGMERARQRAQASSAPASNNQQPYAARVQPQQPRTVPPEAVDRLKSEPTPERMKQFDEVFGAGAAARYMGAR